MIDHFQLRQPKSIGSSGHARKTHRPWPTGISRRSVGLLSMVERVQACVADMDEADHPLQAAENSRSTVAETP